MVKPMATPEVPCPTCGGKGWVWEEDCCADEDVCDSDCWTCHGTGRIPAPPEAKPMATPRPMIATPEARPLTPAEYERQRERQERMRRFARWVEAKEIRFEVGQRYTPTVPTVVTWNTPFP